MARQITDGTNRQGWTLRHDECQDEKDHRLRETMRDAESDIATALNRVRLAIKAAGALHPTEEYNAAHNATLDYLKAIRMEWEAR